MPNKSKKDNVSLLSNETILNVILNNSTEFVTLTIQKYKIKVKIGSIQKAHPRGIVGEDLYE